MSSISGNFSRGSSGWNSEVEEVVNELTKAPPGKGEAIATLKKIENFIRHNQLEFKGTARDRDFQEDIYQQLLSEARVIRDRFIAESSEAPMEPVSAQEKKVTETYDRIAKLLDPSPILDVPPNITIQKAREYGYEGMDFQEATSHLNKIKQEVENYVQTTRSPIVFKESISPLNTALMCISQSNNYCRGLCEKLESASNGKINNTADAIKCLKWLGADINAKLNSGRTALMLAAINGHTDIAAELINARADHDAKDNSGRTALTWAAGNGHTDIAAELINARADTNAKDNFGETALMLAAINGHTDTAAKLIDARADLDAKNNWGQTALMWAAGNGHTDTAAKLIDAGANTNAKANFLGETALMWAARSGHIDIVAKLLNAGAAKDDLEKALMLATKEGHTAVAAKLRDAGASLEGMDTAAL